MTPVLRATAIAIAVASVIDPSWRMMARGRPRVSIVRQHAASESERQVLERLTARLGRDFEVVPGPDESAAAAIGIGTDYDATGIPDRQRAYTIAMLPPPDDPDIRVTGLRAPADAPRGTLIHLEADVEATNASGAESVLVVRTGQPEVEVARATHTWTGPRDSWHPSIDATPLGPPPWRMHVAVSAASRERALDDNDADVMVDAAEPARVLVVDLRPSWASTFVRRALERDTRFDVTSVSYPSRGITVSSGDARSLQSTSFESIRAIVVGGLDRLTSTDAGTLERFMRERAGSVLLLPDSLADARAAARWLPISMPSEVLLEKPLPLVVDAPLSPFESSELLRFEESPLSRALARTTGQNEPVVSVTPVGAGRMVVSGALDAWRYRADGKSAFDRFWQAVVYGIAMNSPPPIDIEVQPPVIASGGRLDVRVRVRRSALGLTTARELRVSATGPGGDPVRLWPDPAPDSFHGSFTAPGQVGAGRLSISVGDRATASRPFVVSAGARTARSSGPPLSLLAETHRGINVTPDRLDDLEQRLRRDVASPALPIERRPMRSMWWMAPFAACLSGEWWLRRRRGLR